jgi:hypothetical protein
MAFAAAMGYDHHPMESNALAPRSHGRRWLVAAVVAMSALVVPTSPGSPASPLAGVAPTGVAHAAGLGAGGEYHPLTPARIFDSRTGLPGSEYDVAPLGAKPIGANPAPTFDIQVLGRGGVPASAAEVLGVVVNVTVTEPSQAGFLNAYATGSQPGIAAIVNFARGQTVPNTSIVRPGVDGKVTVVMSGAPGTAHVVVDVFGWFSTSSATERGARLVPVTPGRILDTRSGLNRTPASPLGPQEFLTVPIRGVDAVEPATTDIVPNDPDVVGVVLNMAGVNTTPGSTPTHLSVVPSALPAGAVPGTANLNLVRNQIKSNMVIVPVDPADGSIRLFNNAGTTDVVFDVVGYLLDGEPESTRSGRVVPLSTPFRLFDTREAAWGSVELGPGQAEPWSFSDFAGSVTVGSEAVGAQSAVIGNLTAASVRRQYASQPLSGSYLTAWPTGATQPTSANLNMVENQIVPNMVILKYGSTPSLEVSVYNFAGYVHYVFDASAVVLRD